MREGQGQYAYNNRPPSTRSGTCEPAKPSKIDERREPLELLEEDVIGTKASALADRERPAT